MNKLFLIAVILAISTLNVDALRKTKLNDKVAVSAPEPTQAQSSLLEGETSSFELNNFYEYFFYCQAYELYNDYALNTNLYCSTVKRQQWYGKKLDAYSNAAFCRLIGSQINSSYLSSYLCSYIQNTANWFGSCAY